MRLPKRQHTSGDHPLADRGPALRADLDALVDDYVSWREACDFVAAAYSNWRRAGRSDQTLAFSEYVAALNCEEEAAAAYEHAVARVSGFDPRPARQDGR